MNATSEPIGVVEVARAESFWHRERSLPPPPDLKTAFLTLAGLCGFAIVNPLLTTLGNGPTFFTAHDAGRWDVVLFVAAVCLAPPLAALAIFGLIRLAGDRPAASITFAGLSGALVAAAIVPALDEWIGLRIRWFAITLLTLGVLAATAWLGSQSVRRVTRAMWFSPAVFAAVFFFMSPASGLVLPAQAVAGAAEIGAPYNVVMIAFDELPLAALLDDALQIDRSRFPGFASLADVSTWYPNATTPSSGTHQAIPAALTGTYTDPRSVLPIVERIYPHNLFSLLSASHGMKSLEPVSRLCTAPGCQLGTSAAGSLYRDAAAIAAHALAPENLGERLAPIDGQWAFFGGSKADPERVFKPSEDSGKLSDLAEFIELAGKPPSSKSSLWFAHVLLPHHPYEYLPGDLRYDGARLPLFEPGTRPRTTWPNEPGAVHLMRQRLLLQLQAVDSHIGQFVSKLKASPERERTALVVMADHGMRFEPGEDARFAPFDAQAQAAIAAVPLFISYPGQATGRIDRRAAEISDVLPTLADLMDADAAWDFDGVSLLAPEQRDRQRFVAAGRRLIPIGAELPIEQEVARYHDAIGLPGLSGGLFGLGPISGWVGQPYSTLPTGEAAGRGSLLNAEEFEGIKPGGPVVPALVQATVGADVEGEWGAVVLNGVVAGTGPIFVDSGQRQFAAVVDPRYFRPGRNDVQILVWDPSAEQFQPLVGAP